MFWRKKQHRKTDQELRESIAKKTSGIESRGRSTFVVDDPQHTDTYEPWSELSGRDTAQFKRQR